ncbi:hypothetical protein BDN72DRAFT_853899 [Pluteus cervinus]|uniref:Uncharacterized protein n=1 Tax=Pluteus cervinus TaxID=181527 RepID=A0ACD3BA18_9AGAR|nr:hypothetical protein BDN72DRAFT_853899 [Pluteus cervinus]
MRFTTAVVTAAALVVTGVEAVPNGFGGFGGGGGGGGGGYGGFHIGGGFNFGFGLNSGNHYGAPTPPWKKGCKPGWYLGTKPSKHPGIPCLTDNTCKYVGNYNNKWSNHLCHPKTTTTSHHHTTTTTTTTSSTSSAPSPTPTLNDGYYNTFTNLTAASQADSYMTFGLVDTIDDCLAMCDNTDECVYVNTYFDVNGKDGSTQLTCSLFKECLDASTADNRGGQTQPDGTVDAIADSDGWCKSS